VDDLNKGKFSTLPGLELRSQSLYRLRYPGSHNIWCIVQDTISASLYEIENLEECSYCMGQAVETCDSASDERAKSTKPRGMERYGLSVLYYVHFD
jgi:hypothetical protein